MIGTARRVSFGKETGGWGALVTTLNAAASPAATTIVVNGIGGNTYGVAPLAVGMYVFFNDGTTEARKLISNVSLASTTATLTIPALSVGHSLGAKVTIGYQSTTALLFNSFSAKRKLNFFSPMPYTGTRAKNVGRFGGRVEADGAMDFQLRPSVNMPMITKGIGQDKNVTGTVPGSPVNTTLSAGVAAGVTSITVASASGLAIGNIIQLDTGTLAECRKISNIVTTTITLDVATTYAHANASAVALVIAPFTHTIASANADLDSFSIEDYIPYDDTTQSNGQTVNAYYMPGCKISELKFKGNSTQGIDCSLDYMFQDKVVIPDANQSIAIPTENVFTFDMEAVVVAGTTYLRCMEVELSVSNDLQKRYTKKGDKRPFTIKAGQQEIKGSFKFYEDATSQSAFWTNLNNTAQIALTWTVTDPSTGYSVTFSCPKIVIEDLDDGDFGPGDLVDMTIPFTATMDTGGTNVQMTLTAKNGDYLAYT